MEQIKMMEDYLKQIKELSKSNKEKAIYLARTNLIKTGIIDNQGNLKPPYNGTFDDKSFTIGPKKIIKK